MKFQLAEAAGFQITKTEADQIFINGIAQNASFLLFPDTGAQAWVGIPAAQISSMEEIVAAWKAIVDYAPVVLVIGTGVKHVFPHPSLLKPLIDARIGYEIMATAAACRTYNVLISEGRRACAALVL